MLGIDVADRPMVVGADLEPVVDAAQHDVGGKDVGHRAVVELDVHHGEVVDVVVVAADVTFVAEGRQPGNGVGPGGNRLAAGSACRRGCGLRPASDTARPSADGSPCRSARRRRSGPHRRNPPSASRCGPLRHESRGFARRSFPGSPAPSGSPGRRPSSRHTSSRPLLCRSAARIRPTLAIAARRAACLSARSQWKSFEPSPK